MTEFQASCLKSRQDEKWRGRFQGMTASEYASVIPAGSLVQGIGADAGRRVAGWRFGLPKDAIEFCPANSQ